MAGDDVPTPVALKRLIDAHQITEAICVITVLGIPDLLRDGPSSAKDLAAATATHAGALYRLLRALATVEVVQELADQHFALTPVGQHLRPDDPASLAGWARYTGRPYLWRTWGELLHSVRTGENAFEHLYGQNPWEYRAAHPEENAIFNDAMTALSRGAMDAVVAAYDFGRLQTVVDVGGGRGELLAAILRQHPHLRGILFDLPHVVTGIDLAHSDPAIAGRCAVVGGDFFVAVPAGGDTYVLRAILHDWDDERSIAILSTCRRAMAPSSRLLIIEWTIEPPNEGREGKFSDLRMLVVLGGQERTPDAYGALLQAAGLQFAAVYPTATGHAIIEGIPV